MRRGWPWALFFAAVAVLVGCGTKEVKSCDDLMAKVKPGMTKKESEEAIGPPDESGLGLAGDYANYKCGGDGEFLSLTMRGDKVSGVVKIGGDASPRG